MSNRIEKDSLQDGSPEETRKCPVCRLMYGHSTFNFLCSRCYRESKEGKKLQQYTCRIKAEKQQQKILEKPIQPPIEKQQEKAFQPEEKIKNERVDQLKETINMTTDSKDMEPNFDFLKRPISEQFKPQQVKCIQCQRKTKLLGYDCRHCLRHFCKDHRMPESHSCEVDFFAISQQQKKAALKSSGKKKGKIAEI